MGSTWRHPYNGASDAGVTPSEADSESEAFWPSVMGEERAENEAFWPSPAAPPRQRSFRPFNLSSGVVAAARPSLFHVRTSTTTARASACAAVRKCLCSRAGVEPAANNRTGLLVAAVAAAFALMSLALGTLLVHTQLTQPLLPLSPNSLQWNAHWLNADAADYYGACFCLCGVIACSEPRGQAACWWAGCCLLGAPACCLYVSVRLCRHGSLTLR